jgi:hypothetical protein
MAFKTFVIPSRISGEEFIRTVAAIGYTEDGDHAGAEDVVARALEVLDGPPFLALADALTAAGLEEPPAPEPEEG